MTHRPFVSWLVLSVMLGACAAAAAETPQGRLEVTVTEAGGSGPLPCRVHLKAGGQPVYAPGLPKFTRDPHFSCPGRFAVDVPAGEAAIRIERGLEYLPHVETVRIEAGKTRTLKAELRPWIDMNARGWFSGDLHVHRPPRDMALLMRADDLNVAPVLTHWNQRHMKVEPPYRVEASDDGAARFYVAWMDDLIATYETKRAAAKNKEPFDTVLETYRRARVVYEGFAKGD